MSEGESEPTGVWFSIFSEPTGVWFSIFQDLEGYGFDGHIFSVSFLQSFFFFCRDAILKVASRNSLRSEARRRLKNQRREIASIVEFCRNNPQAHLWLDPVLSRRLWTRTARNLLPPHFHLWEALSARVQQGSISHPLLFGESDSVLLSWSSGGASCGAGHWARSWEGEDYSLWSMFWWCLGAIDPIRQVWRGDQNAMIPSSF